MTDVKNAAAVISFALLVGCGYGQFQTARTTPPGEVRFTAAQLYLVNENMEERGGVNVANFPQQLDFRVGLSEQVDLGIKFFLLLGLLVDSKINLMTADNDFALAIHGGIGGAAVDSNSDDESTAAVIHLPIGAIASYRLWGVLSPYLGLDYGFYWIIGRELEYRDPEKVYADREGYGDGLVRTTVGLEWMMTKQIGLLIEYDLLVPVVDDPGDNFAFVTNHMVGVGLLF